jgi:cation transport ATPase
MDTLIALGTGTAYFYSLFVTLFPGIVGNKFKIVGAAMAFSSVSVVSNALRLRNFQPGVR